MKLCNTKLLSIGRDGKICIWKKGNDSSHPTLIELFLGITDHRNKFSQMLFLGNPLQLLSWSKPSTAVEMEWPCRFFETTNQLYVAGFRGVSAVFLKYAW